MFKEKNSKSVTARCHMPQLSSYHRLRASLTSTGSMSSKDKVLQNDVLLDLILWHVYSHCDREAGLPYCNDMDDDDDDICLHSTWLLYCALVCRQWSKLGVRHLWKRYADFKELFQLIGSLQAKSVSHSNQSERFLFS